MDRTTGNIWKAVAKVIGYAVGLILGSFFLSALLYWPVVDLNIGSGSKINVPAFWKYTEITVNPGCTNYTITSFDNTARLYIFPVCVFGEANPTVCENGSVLVKSSSDFEGRHIMRVQLEDSFYHYAYTSSGENTHWTSFEETRNMYECMDPPALSISGDMVNVYYDYFGAESLAPVYQIVVDRMVASIDEVK